MVPILILSLAGLSELLFVLENSTKPKKEFCESPDLFQKLTDTGISTSQCLKNYGDYADFFYGLYAEKDLSQYLKNRCDTRDEFNQCTKDVFYMSRQCYEPKDIKILDTWRSIGETLLEYVCNNKIEGAFAKDQYSCWKDIHNETLICFPQELKASVKSNVFYNIEQITCREFQEAEICMRNILPQYCNKEATEALATALNVIGKHTCQKSTTINRARRSVALRRIVREVGGAHKLSHIEHRVRNLCISNGHPSEKLNETLDELKTCMNKKQIFSVPKQEYLAHIDQCTKKPITLFKSCLPDKYKYLPQLLFDIVDSMVSFLYDDFTIIGTELSPCLPKLQSQESIDEHDKCVEKVTDTVEADIVESKEEFCKNWIPLNECYIKQVKKDCKSSPELTKFENDYMSAVKKPCEKKKQE